MREQSGTIVPERENEMAKVKVTLNLKQVPFNHSSGETAFDYLVVKATNTTDPKVNEYLTEKLVKSLVRDGVTVNVTADADD